jgi:hypothetical protein
MRDRFHRLPLVLFAALALAGPMLCMGTLARADVATVDVSGVCPGPQSVALRLTIDFTPSGPGTATVRFTLENTSGVYPFQSPAIGNPVLTGFFFNIPGGATANYTDGRLLAGGTLVSSGGSINGIPVPAGCTTLLADVPQTAWYELVVGQATGQYGIFTSGVSTVEGIKGGLADPDIVLACAPQGDVFSPIYFAGRARFTVQLSNLPASFDSAGDLLALCSTVQGEQSPSSVAGKMQGTGENGEGSCYAAEPCSPTPTRGTSWGMVKAIYR